MAVNRITSAPGFHWFGYYDKHLFSPDGTTVLGMRVGFEGRSPRPEDEVLLGVIDLADGNRWTDIGRTTAWCWQQGCMLQWVPGMDATVIWNERGDGRYVSRCVDLDSGEVRAIPMAIYALCPDGRTAVSADFRRINDTRPGYGYAGFADPHADENAPSKSGIWRMDLRSGETDLILSIADIVQQADTAVPRDAKHWFNHLLVNPAGTRFVFLHRWRPDSSKGFRTRMLSAALDGSDVRVVEDGGSMSHFVWDDDSHVLAYTKPTGNAWGFYRIDAVTGETALVLDEHRNGHCTVVPQSSGWILNDTYPQGDDRAQYLYLAHPESGRRVELGEFATPEAYAGEWRCDLHPCANPQGTQALFCSTHEGHGRQMYVADLA